MELFAYCVRHRSSPTSEKRASGEREESNEEMCEYIYREREGRRMGRESERSVGEGGLTRHHPQTIKYRLGSCLPAKFISVPAC